MEPSPFQPQIAQIKATYAEFEARGMTRTRWAPFGAEEAEVRARQALAFAQLMRGAGRLHLEGLRILDLGCGSGRHLRQCLDMGAEPELLHGIELDEAALARARRLSPNLDFQPAGGDTIGFPDATFDLVTHHFVFSSVPGGDFRARLAAEVRRVLKPGGHFFWWDMPHMALAAGGHAEPLDARDHFSGEIVSELRLGAKPRPSETLWPKRIVRRLLAPIADLLAYPPIFQAALIKPHAS